MNADQIAAGGVQNALRFSGRAAGVENVKRMLAIERDRRAIGVDVFELAMPPDIAAFLDVNLVSGAAKNDHPLDRAFLPLSASSTFCLSGTMAPRR